MTADSTSPEPGSDSPDGYTLKPATTTRSRWATRKMTVKSSQHKRLSILNRMRAGANEKGQDDGSDPPPLPGQVHAAPAATANAEANDGESGATSRTLFFNTPLPPEFLDEEGAPLFDYPRNKIRTAKFTPLSFIPKELWFQFHNIANIFFLFLVVLGVCIQLKLVN